MRVLLAFVVAAAGFLISSDQILGAGLVKAYQVGDQLPDLEFKSSDDRIHRLSDFKGSLVMLNFWATWCPPCLEEIPYMEALNQRFRAKPFSMLAVSVDSSWKDVETFKTRIGHEFSFLVLLDSDKIAANLLGTSKFPETFVIGPDGRLLKKYVGAINWLSNQVLAEWDEFFRKTK